MSNRFYFVHANPEAWNKIGEFLAAHGEVVESEMVILLYAQTEYLCRRIRDEGKELIHEYRRNNPDIATSVRLFEWYEGRVKNINEVSDNPQKSRRILNSRLTPVATGGIRGASGSRNQLLK